MSHFTTVKTKINDVQALVLALRDLEFTVTHNTRVNGWGGTRRKAEVVATTQGSPYGIGFIMNPQSNNYDMVADWWGIQSTTGIHEQQVAQKITQRYAYHKVLAEVKKQGFLVAEDRVESDQTIRLVVRKW